MQRFLTACLVLIGLFACSQDVPRLPQDIPNLSIKNCVSPSQGVPTTTLGWDEPFTNLGLPHPDPEVIETYDLNAKSVSCRSDVVYCGQYNLNKGRLEEERTATRLNPSKTYIIFEVEGVIAIVTYLMEFIWDNTDKNAKFFIKRGLKKYFSDRA